MSNFCLCPASASHNLLSLLSEDSALCLQSSGTCFPLARSTGLRFHELGRMKCLLLCLSPLRCYLMPSTQQLPISPGRLCRRGASDLPEKGAPLTLPFLPLLLATVFVAAILFWDGVPLCRFHCLTWNSLSWDSDGSWQVPSRPPFQIWICSVHSTSSWDLS